MRGSTLEARRAGIQVAPSATSVSSIAEAANMRGSDALTWKASDDNHRPSAKAPTAPSARPAATMLRGLAQHQATNLGPGGAERNANRDLPRPLADVIRKHTVEPERRQRHRHTRERHHQHEGEPFAVRSASDHVGQRCRPVHDELGIEPRHGGADGRARLLDRPVAGDDLGQRPVAVVGELSMGAVDSHGGCAVDIERNVADHADNLHLGAAGGNPLPQGAVQRRPGKACRAKAALTMARRGAPAASRSSKSRPARSGIPSAARPPPLTTRCCIGKPLPCPAAVPARGPLRMCVFQG